MLHCTKFQTPSADQLVTAPHDQVSSGHSSELHLNPWCARIDCILRWPANDWKWGRSTYVGFCHGKAPKKSARAVLSSTWSHSLQRIWLHTPHNVLFLYYLPTGGDLHWRRYWHTSYTFIPPPGEELLCSICLCAWGVGVWVSKFECLPSPPRCVSTHT